MEYVESERVELKQKLTDDVKKEIVAFLNSNGGTIYVGVKDNGELESRECGHFIGPSFRILANIPLNFYSRVLS